MQHEHQTNNAQYPTNPPPASLLPCNREPFAPSGMDPSTLLTTGEAAAYLGVAKKTLETWRSTGRYPLRYIKVGNRVRYRLRDLDEWLASRMQEHTGQGEGGQA